MQWNQKEAGLLKDLKDQEQLCVNKYTRHARQAKDPQLKNLFTQIARTEQEHLRTITELELGRLPQMGGGGGQELPRFSGDYSGSAEDRQTDSYLCSDVLSTEKHASHLYDTCVFEFRDQPVRSILNHIQKEEQEHGKMLYDYMSANGMYS